MFKMSKFGESYDEFKRIYSTHQELYNNNYIIQRNNPDKYLIMRSIDERQYIPYDQIGSSIYGLVKNVDCKHLNTISVLRYSFEDLEDVEMYVRNICGNNSDKNFYSTYISPDNSYFIYMSTFNGRRCKLLLTCKTNRWHVIRLYTAYWNIPKIQEAFTLN